MVYLLAEKEDISLVLFTGILSNSQWAKSYVLLVMTKQAIWISVFYFYFYFYRPNN